MTATKMAKTSPSLSLAIIAIPEASVIINGERSNLMVAKCLCNDNGKISSSEKVYPASEGIKPAMDLIKSQLPVKTVLVGLGELNLPPQYRLMGFDLPLKSLDRARELAKSKYPSAFEIMAETVAENLPPKRGRGRPRKIQPAV